MTEPRWRLTEAKILLAAGNGGVKAGAEKKQFTRNLIFQGPNKPKTAPCM